MLQKIRGIVLHQIKYTDSGIVVQLYTRETGRLSVLARGVHRRKSGKHSVMFQPMSLLDMEVYFKSSREIQLLKEFSFAYPMHDLNSNIRKSTVAIFLGEVLSSVLREETPNEALYSFIESSVEWFDECRDKYQNFHISFLAGLSRYLGFEPRIRNYENNTFFDMMNGTFVDTPPQQGQYATEDVSALLALFLRSSIRESADISLNGKQRNELLETIVKFYSLHLPALGKLKSLDILRDVFA